MAIDIEANYAKKLGLPNYSSHAYSVTVRTTVQNLEQIEAECARLYALLQALSTGRFRRPDLRRKEMATVCIVPMAATDWNARLARAATIQIAGNAVESNAI